MVNRKQELNTLRGQIDSIHNSIKSIHNFESDNSFLSDQEIVSYIKYLEAAKTRLTIRSQSIEGSGGQLPVEVVEALQAAEEELRSIVQEYQNRNTMLTDAIGGSAKIRELRRLEVGRNPNERIQNYLRLHPTIPGGVNDNLISDESTDRYSVDQFPPRQVFADTSNRTTRVKQEPLQSIPKPIRTSRIQFRQEAVASPTNKEVIHIEDDVFLPNVPVALLLTRGILIGFPNWTSLLDGTKAQRNPQDQIENGEERYGQKLFMMDRISYWLTNRRAYLTDESSIRGRFTRYFSNDDKEFQLLRSERASALIEQYGPYLPRGLLLNEPFLYFANVDRTFEEEKPFIDRTNRELLTEAQVLSRLQLIDNESKTRRLLEQTGLVTLEDKEVENPYLYID